MTLFGRAFVPFGAPGAPSALPAPSSSEPRALTICDAESSGRASRQTLKMTSNVVSRERKDVNVYLVARVVTWIAFGITNAVMRLSSATTSYIGIVSCGTSACQ